GDHLVGVQSALAVWLERDKHPRRVGAAAIAAARERDDVVDGGILGDDIRVLAQVLGKRLERSVLVGLYCTLDSAGILLREKPLGNSHVQVAADDDHGDGYRQHESR